ncbi:glycosyltransferase family 61 protein [Swingsia samuiensis]|uniref:Glycosyltransferase family 61 protein n=1 Tax=Swingsia samuiensis TaxID=1293412 RepID=A0A4Y6UH09_9PROT|nr:glycosyltransferase family 61 protein [Swingsia samuiensis]QDH16852.1 glycosyltransferase family 61 protein [Swingsia samuiensis]
MLLKECTSFSGRRLILENLPPIRHAQDAVFIPRGDGPFWGLFEASGRSVPEALNYTGFPKLHTPLSSLDCPALPDVPTLSDKYDYWYIGEVNLQYGHFLIENLSRLWAIPSYERTRLRIILSYHEEIENIFKYDYFKSIMEALHLTQENFIQIKAPTRFENIKVASAAFEDFSLIYRVYADFVHSIGRYVLPYKVDPQPGRVLYFSKEHLRAGKTRIGNEAELTNILKDKGVGIIFPEQMSFREQIKLWASNPIVAGFSSASLYTSLFFPRRNTVTLSYTENVNVNHVLVDDVNQNNARYLNASPGLEALGAGDGFQMNYRIQNVQKFAEEFLDMVM